MAKFKLTKADEAERVSLVKALEAGRTVVNNAVEAAQAAIASAVDTANVAVRDYNATVERAREFASTHGDDFRSELDDRSERWQESDAGQAALSFVESWEGAELDDLDELVLPDLDELEMDHPETLQDLPEEADQ